MQNTYLSMAELTPQPPCFWKKSRKSVPPPARETRRGVWVMIITQTPLRVSLAGGGTDFRDFFQKHGGCGVSSAIDKYVFCIVKERFDEKIFVNYSKKEIRSEE